MNYEKQYCTSRICREAIWEQLRSLLLRFKNHGFEEVELLFGAAWGNYVYSSSQWEYEKLPINEIESRIREEENKKTGRLCDDDLYIQLPSIPLEIQLCHESDLHLWFNEKTALIEEIVSAWSRQGLDPQEYLNNKKN